MKTFLAKKETVQPKWHLIDADGVVLGRLAVKAANQMTATSQGTPMDLKAFVGTENI